MYVYNIDILLQRYFYIRKCFPQTTTSFAVKANPHAAIIRTLERVGSSFDASSRGEIEHLLSMGVDAKRISFSGPAKNVNDIEFAVRSGIGSLVIESMREAKSADAAAEHLMTRQSIAVRIAPDWIPTKFGTPMGGRPTQFGIDEANMKDAISMLSRFEHLDFNGIHVFSGTGCLSEQSLVESFQYNVDLIKKASMFSKFDFGHIILGAGFGIPYSAHEKELDLEMVGFEFGRIIEQSCLQPVTIALELGRWLVGPTGWFLTRVVSEKESKGVSFRICDGGFNNHLAACGMLGTAIRQNWKMSNLSNLTGGEEAYTLVGPLCTGIDVLARNIHLPRLSQGDVIAVHNSGAYGLTASPFAFISHSVPFEIFIQGEAISVSDQISYGHFKKSTTA
jgi:diaminopimelate decarboxylase